MQGSKGEGNANAGITKIVRMRLRVVESGTFFGLFGSGQFVPDPDLDLTFLTKKICKIVANFSKMVQFVSDYNLISLKSLKCLKVLQFETGLNHYRTPKTGYYSSQMIFRLFAMFLSRES